MDISEVGSHIETLIDLAADLSGRVAELERTLAVLPGDADQTGNVSQFDARSVLVRLARIEDDIDTALAPIALPSARVLWIDKTKPRDKWEPVSPVIRGRGRPIIYPYDAMRIEQGFLVRDGKVSYHKTLAARASTRLSRHFVVHDAPGGAAIWRTA